MWVCCRGDDQSGGTTQIGDRGSLFWAGSDGTIGAGGQGSGFKSTKGTHTPGRLRNDKFKLIVLCAFEFESHFYFLTNRHPNTLLSPSLRMSSLADIFAGVKTKDELDQQKCDQET